MSEKKENQPAADGKSEAEAPKKPAKEIGGPKATKDGIEPTRFGDWEKSGRCIDF